MPGSAICIYLSQLLSVTVVFLAHSIFQIASYVLISSAVSYTSFFLETFDGCLPIHGRLICHTVEAAKEI